MHEHQQQQKQQQQQTRMGKLCILNGYWIDSFGNKCLVNGEIKLARLSSICVQNCVQFTKETLQYHPHILLLILAVLAMRMLSE